MVKKILNKTTRCLTSVHTSASLLHLDDTLFSTASLPGSHGNCSSEVLPFFILAPPLLARMHDAIMSSGTIIRVAHFKDCSSVYFASEYIHFPLFFLKKRAKRMAENEVNSRKVCKNKRV